MEISAKKMFAEGNFSSPQKNNGPSLTGSCRLGNYNFSLNLLRDGPLENLWGGGRNTKKKFAQGKIK